MRSFRLFPAFLVTLLCTLGTTLAIAQPTPPKPASAASIELDTLIEQFSRQDLICQDAITAFKGYVQKHPGNAQSLVYLGRAYDRMASFIGECYTDDKLTLAYEDTALRYFKQAQSLDKNVRELKNGFTMSQMIGHLFGSRAMLALYQGNGKLASDELARGLSEGGYSETMMQYARLTLSSLDSNAILFSFGDDDTFPLWYVQLTQGYRRDVTLVNASLLNTPWYQALVRKGIPGYVTAAEFERINGPKDKDVFYSNRQIIEYDSLRRLPNRMDEVDLDPAVQSRISAQIGRAVPAKITLSALHESSAGAGLTGLTYEGIGRILRANAWKRPVYFQPSGFVGYFNRVQPYLRMEGLVSQIFPDSGADYIPRKEEWLDTTRFVQSLNRILERKEILQDPIVAQYVSGVMMPELYQYAARAQTMEQIQQSIDMGRTVAQSDVRNAAWYYGELVLRLAEKGHVKSTQDLQWIASALEATIKQTPQGYLTEAHTYYARALAALDECSALNDYVKALTWAAKAPPQSAAAEYYKEITASQAGCASK